MNTDTDLKITTAKCFTADRPRMRALGKRLKALDKGAGSSQQCVISRALDALERETKAAAGILVTGAASAAIGILTEKGGVK